jgi:hypothetical protein
VTDPTAPEPLPDTGPRREPSRGELLRAAAAALLLAALALLDGLLGLGQSSLLAPDTATSAAPWSLAIESEAERPRNPDLSDQGVVFYPGRRWLLESLSRGDLPLWNPLIFAGAPALGNPQLGVLDPQVLALWPLQALWGERGLWVGLFLSALLRLWAAGFGAYWLARRLGLGAPGAALAGLGFGLGGYLVLWLGSALGHVTPFLPWLLLAVESQKGPRPGSASLATALGSAAMILAGHPETSFYVGAAAGLWALAVFAEDRRAGGRALLSLAAGVLLAAPGWWPFLEYLEHSSAQVVRRALVAAGRPDFLVLGALLLVGTLLWRLPPEGAGAPQGGWRRSVGLAALILGLFALLARRGLPEGAVLTLFPDLFGRSGAGGYRGPGTYLEEASAWLSAPVLGLALSGLFEAGPARLRRRRLVLLTGALALLLVLRTPGLLELKQRLPLVGLGATVRLAAVSSLMLSLLAGEALERAGATARRAAGLTLAGLGLWVLLWPAAGGPGAPASATPEADELVGFLHLPPARLEGPSAPFEGWLSPGLPELRAALRVERLEPPGVPGAPTEQGGSFELPLELYQAPLDPQDLARAPPGARFFRSNYLQTSRLGPGLWAFDLLLYPEGQLEPIVRRGASARVARALQRSGAGPWLWGLTAAVLLLALRWQRIPLLCLAAAGGLWFARGMNPAVPAAEVFPLTATEAYLAQHQGSGRFFSDPGVFPPCTGMVRGLRALDGYDGLDPHAYNEFRALCLEPGVQGLLGWNVRGVRLSSGPFRLFGVNHLVLKEPAECAGFRLVAAPDGSAPNFAECFIYAALEALPNARLVAKALPTSELRASLARGEPWDPALSAAYDGEFRLERPLSSGTVREISRGNDHISLDVSVDGDALLCLAEMYFPGWSCTIDGRPAPVERVNGLFRGVGLHAGQQRVEFRYRPTHLSAALLLAAAGLLAALLLARSAQRSPAEPPAPRV